MARTQDAPEDGGLVENVGARAPIVACDVGCVKAVKASNSEADIFDI